MGIKNAEFEFESVIKIEKKLYKEIYRDETANNKDQLFQAETCQ
jgi:hypothetical protein